MKLLSPEIKTSERKERVGKGSGRVGEGKGRGRGEEGREKKEISINIDVCIIFPMWEVAMS